MSERETVWCEAHGGLSNPHFEQDDCVHPHFTDQQTRARMNAEDVDPVDELRETYGDSELANDRNPTEDGFVRWLVDEHLRLTGKVRVMSALADRYAQNGRDVLHRGEVRCSDVADAIRTLLAD